MDSLYGRHLGHRTRDGYPSLADFNQTTIPLLKMSETRSSEGLFLSALRVPLSKQSLLGDYLRRHLKGKGLEPPSAVAFQVKSYLQHYLKGKNIPKMTEGLAKAFQEKNIRDFRECRRSFRIATGHLRLRAVLP
jgi:hypothetical protein